jgi:hypothetical protein
MLTGLFFLGGLLAFVYLCWWIYDNERHPDGALPRRGLLAMAAVDDVAEEAAKRKTPAWKRDLASESAPKPDSKAAKRSRAPSQRRTRR